MVNNILDVEAMMCGHEIQLKIRHFQPLAPKGNSTREQLTITTNEMLPGPPIWAVKDHAPIWTKLIMLYFVGALAHAHMEQATLFVVCKTSSS